MGYLDKAGLSRAFTKLKTLIDKKQDAMKTVAIPSSSSTNKGKWIKFATVDLSSASAWQACSGVLSFVRGEGLSPQGVMNFEVRNGNTAGTVTTTYFTWTSLSDNAYVGSVSAVKVSNGKYDIYYKPVYDYETCHISLVNGLNTGYFTFNTGSYVESITAATTSVITSYASSLATARTIRTDLGSTSSASFNGTANVTPGVTGTLPVANGGTGATNAANARTNLGLGAAATYGVTTSATSGSSALITSGAVYTGLAGKASTAVVTTSTSGLMSATDKTKLDGIASGANNYSLPTATATTKGGVTIGSNITVSSGAISLTKANVTNALGYTPPTTNTTYSTGSSSSSGLTKLYTATGTATDGTMTQNAITTALSGKAASSHTHNYAGSSSAGGNATWANGATYANYSYNDKPITTGGTGSAYTASVSGLTLAAGASFVMVPNVVSTTTAPTLNVNSLGAKTIRMRISSSTSATVALPSASFLAASKPVRMVYDGTYWIIDDLVMPDANNTYGTLISRGTAAPTSSTAGYIYIQTT